MLEILRKLISQQVISSKTTINLHMYTITRTLLLDNSFSRVSQTRSQLIMLEILHKLISQLVISSKTTINLHMYTITGLALLDNSFSDVSQTNNNKV